MTYMSTLRYWTTTTFVNATVKVLKLVLLMPFTNAVSERSASTMGRIKTYLCSIMTLDNVMVLHIYLTKNLGILNRLLWLKKIAVSNMDSSNNFH